jgi:hypothetical protein
MIKKSLNGILGMAVEGKSKKNVVMEYHTTPVVAISGGGGILDLFQNERYKAKAVRKIKKLTTERNMSR